MKRIVLASFLSLNATFSAAAESLPVPERGFVSCQPAKTWEEGLICGNGTIGANALSRPLKERIIFTHERLFLPMGPPVMPPDQSARLFEIRRLIDRGLYKQACELQANLSGQDGFMYPDYFVPAFDLSIQTQAEGEVRDFARSVDFRTGEAVVHWADDRGVFERRMFVSRAAGVAVLLLTAPKSALDCRLALEPREPSDEFNSDSDVNKRSDQVFKEHVSDIKSTAGDSWLTYSNRFTKAYPGSIHALESYARVVATGGTAKPQDDGSFVVTGADRLLLFVDIRMLYDPDKSVLEEMKRTLAQLPADYGRLLDEHAKLHGQLFNRMRLDLGGGADHQRTTEELLELSTYENPNRALIEKEFDAARYNIISSTGELPPTLQGVWGGTYVPGWASDFTHNGNVPSAIASYLMGNMPELMLAYTSYIESITPWMEINAKHLFGARGVVLPSRSTTHGFNNAFNPRLRRRHVGRRGGLGGSLFLRLLPLHRRPGIPGRTRPAVHGESGGVLRGLSVRRAGRTVRFFANPVAGEHARQLELASLLQRHDGRSGRQRAAPQPDLRFPRSESKPGQDPGLGAMLAKMPEYMIDDNGIIKEWLTPRLENNDDHRHCSQLYPLFDGMPDEIAQSPELRAAFRKSIEYKLDKHWKNNQRGFMSFGLVQLGQAATSLGEGELAYHCLRHLVNRFWLNNLASMHNHRSLFNMDISGGMPAVIIKMLVASDVGKIQLLPALPAAWPSGRIEGALCRGAIEIQSLQWEGKQVTVKLSSARSQTVTLELPTEIAEFSLTGGAAKASPAERTNQRAIALPSGQSVTMVIQLK